MQNLSYNEMMGDPEANSFNYAGVISMKGNFYPQYFMPDPNLSPEARRSRMASLTAGKNYPDRWRQKRCPTRAKTGSRIPRFSDRLGLTVDYREFPNEGHAPDKTDLELLWGMLN
ncbi:MAG: hypothetical protein U1F16_09550 [Turneriella sp.]